MEPSLQELRQRPHMSISSLKTWITCPRKYEKRYIEKVQPSFTPAALPFGRAFHDSFGFILLERQKRGDVSPAEREEHFRDALARELRADGPPVLFEDDESEEELAQRGTAMLDALLAEVPPPERVLHVELPFMMQLHDPDTGELLPAPLIGGVDAVVLLGGRTVLWELKSAKRRWSEDQVHFDFQATAYRMALKKKYPNLALQLLVATKTKRPDIQVERLVRTKADERDLLVTAASIHRATRAGCFHPLRSWACKTCEYAEACN